MIGEVKQWRYRYNSQYIEKYYNKMFVQREGMWNLNM